MLRIFANPLTLLLSLLSLVPGAGLLGLAWLLHSHYEATNAALPLAISGLTLTLMLLPDIYRAACVTSHRPLVFGGLSSLFTSISVLGFGAFIGIDAPWTDLSRLAPLGLTIATLGIGLFLAGRADAYIKKSREV